MNSLCNWDTLSFDETAQSTNGASSISPCGVQVEIFNNFVAIRDKRSHRLESGLPFPMVGSIYDGEMSYQDMTIRAARGPQQGVYLCSWFTMASCSDIKHFGMVGIGCNGFADGADEHGTTYLGVLPESVDYLLNLLGQWASVCLIPAEFGFLKPMDPLRFNQGDSYVAREAGMNMACSAPGQAAYPQPLAFQHHHSASQGSPAEPGRQK